MIGLSSIQKLINNFILMSIDDSANLVVVPKLDERWRYVSGTAMATTLFVLHSTTQSSLYLKLNLL